MGRNVSSGSVVRSQVDFYFPVGSVARVPGVEVMSLTLTLFFNNVLTAWTLESGASVPDSSISAGKVFFNEVQGAPGFYALRFYPDKTGYWRIVLRNSALSSESVSEFDVTAPAASAAGLNASFSK